MAAICDYGVEAYTRNTGHLRLLRTCLQGGWALFLFEVSRLRHSDVVEALAYREGG